jgi:hypothetical protein
MAEQLVRLAGPLHSLFCKRRPSCRTPHLDFPSCPIFPLSRAQPNRADACIRLSFHLTGISSQLFVANSRDEPKAKLHIYHHKQHHHHALIIAMASASSPAVRKAGAPIKKYPCQYCNRVSLSRWKHLSTRHVLTGTSRPSAVASTEAATKGLVGHLHLLRS